ncbi:MAG TPA: hypothetical protein VGK89_02810 [Candidatus Eisenbacteria bacterium]
MNAAAADSTHNLFRIYLNDTFSLVVEVSPWLVVLILLLLGLAVFRWRRRRFSVVSLDVSLGGIGKAQLRPREEDIEVAHKIWTELVTRKAALPIDPEHDVISEVYDSWYRLFGRIRELVGEIPARLVREDPATRELVRIATDSLNKGLRPHLTRWQARFRNWYANQSEALKTTSPQEVQRRFPEYRELIADLQRVNQELIQYAGELQKLVRGK